MHSGLFDHHLERDNAGSQCRVIQECFDAYAQRCQSQFTPQVFAVMRVLCLSSALHGDQSTISSARTRGLMMLLFLRLWPASTQEQEVILNDKKCISRFGIRDRVFIYMRVAVNISVMELAAWLGLMLYAHTMFSNGAITSSWNGVYDEMLRNSNFSSWNIQRGQDPRYMNDLIYLMSDCLMASLAFCCMFPLPVSSFLILLLPVSLIIQVRCPDTCFLEMVLLFVFVDLFILLHSNGSLLVILDFLRYSARNHSDPNESHLDRPITALSSCVSLRSVSAQLVSSAQLPQ